MSIEYPASVDFVKLGGDMLAFVRGQGDKKVAVKDAWEVAGYALGRTVGEPTMLLTAAPPMSDEKALQAAVNAAEAEKAGKVAAVPPFVWAIVAKIAARILQQALGG